MATPRGTLTHSSGGRRLLAKRRNGTYWLHVEDGFSVVDMPIPDKLAEELAEFLTDGRHVAGSPTTAGSVAPDHKSLKNLTDDAQAQHLTNTCAEEDAVSEICTLCNGTGEAIGLFSGYRVKCPCGGGG